MLGLLSLGLTILMIYTLVKNALTGTQLNPEDEFTGEIDLIIPILKQSEFYFDEWSDQLVEIDKLNNNIKCHLIIDGHHPQTNSFHELKKKFHFIEIHEFISKPAGKEVMPWMMAHLCHSLRGDVVILGDPELVPEKHIFKSLGKTITQKNKAYFVLPQNNKSKLINEAVVSLNPTLAMASLFDFRGIRRNFASPLMSISQGWLAMSSQDFKEIDWNKINVPSWKEAVAKSWALENKRYELIFTDFLKRHYPIDFKKLITEIIKFWPAHWPKGERIGLIFFLATLYIWSFPILYFFSHPFWSIGSLLLLTLYRIFTKIIFRDSWGAVMLHPLGVIVWIGCFLAWVLSVLRRVITQRRP